MVCAIFRRPGWGPQRRHRRPLGQPGQPTNLSLAPHEVWSAEFTGHFTTGDGLSCDPLTVAEGDRRWLLGWHALTSTRVAEAPPVFTRLCNACGWPKRLRPDTGGPVATHPRGRLSPRSAWWVRLGILPACMAPGQPHQHGRHARRPRPRKAEPRALPPPRGGRRRARVSASARRAPASGRTRRSTWVPPPPAMTLPPGSCPRNCHRLSILTAARGVMSALMGASEGAITGLTFPTAAWEKMSASRTLPMGSGMCTAAPSNAGDGSKTHAPRRGRWETDTTPVTVTPVPGLFCSRSPRLVISHE
jgi:hypothetical protein